MNKVMEVRHLTKHFSQTGRLFEPKTKLAAVDDVSFDLFQGEILGLLGESGCGKTTLARMLMHLLQPDSGQVLLDGIEIQNIPERRFRTLRNGLQMVYQNPFDCLDPGYTVQRLLDEPLRLWHKQLDVNERKGRIGEMLHRCGLDPACMKKRPGEFSGGQLQRISIARALLADPRVLIADEIVSALDVPIQNQILQLLRDLQKERGLAVLFITHDLSVARKMSDRVMVMQAGRIKDIGGTEEILLHSQDSYIRALMEAVFTFSGKARQG